MSVSLFFVDITGVKVDTLFYACDNASAAGPFMSSASAIEWRKEFAPDRPVYSKQSTESGVCKGAPLYKNDAGWYRG